MNFTITNLAYAKNVFNTLYKHMQENKNYRLEFEEVKSLKTQKQLGFIFGGVIKALRLYFDRLGYQFTPEQIKEWLYEEIGITETLFLPNGKQKQVKKTLSGMSKKEASDFIFQLITFVDTNEALEDFILPPDLRYCWTHQLDERLIEEVQQYSFPERNEYYLKHQRKLTCIRCGRKGGQVHHIKRGSGLGNKNPDWFTIPICEECHVPYLHSKVGEPAFLNEIKYIIGGLDIELFCQISYYMWLHNYS